MVSNISCNNNIVNIIVNNNIANNSSINISANNIGTIIVATISGTYKCHQALAPRCYAPSGATWPYGPGSACTRCQEAPGCGCSGLFVVVFVLKLVVFQINYQ